MFTLVSLADQHPQLIYKKTPDLTREGGSIPVTLTFAEALGVNVLLLPMGRGDDGAQYVFLRIIPVTYLHVSPCQLNKREARPIELHRGCTSLLSLPYILLPASSG